MGKSFLNKGLVILLFAYTLGVFELESVFALLIIAFVIAICGARESKILVLQKKTLQVPLLVWGVSFVLIKAFIGPASILKNVFYYLIFPFFFYHTGRLLANNYKNNKNGMLVAISIVSIGFPIHGLLNVFFSIKNGIFIHNTEYVYDIWSGGLNNRTIVGIYLTVGLCLFLAFALFGQLNLLPRLFSIFGVIITILATVYIGNRSLLIIAVILSVFAFFIGIKKSRNPLRIVLITSIIIIVICILYFSNAWNVQEFITSSTLYARISGGGMFQSSRWSIFENFDELLWTHIFGQLSGEQIGISLSYAHNIWLDIYLETGIVPLLAFVFFTFRAIKNMFVTIKYNGLTDSFCAIAMTIGLFLVCAVEPVLQADPYWFNSFVAILAIIEGLLYESREGLRL